MATSLTLGGATVSRAASGRDAYRIEIAARYEDAAPRWRALREAGSSLAFQSETWLSSWYEHVGRGDAEPLFATLVDRASGRDLMGLPLVRRRMGRLRAIEFVDAGLTDYNAPILRAQASIDPAALFRALRAALPQADVLRLDKMPPMVGETPNPLARLPGASACRLGGNLLPIHGAWDAWHWGLERTFRKELERSWRVFERRGGTFRRVVDAEDARRTFAALKAQQRARIDELGLPYILDEPQNEAFYDRLVAQGLAEGEVVLTTLEAGGEMVAGLLGLARGAHYSMVRLSQAGGDWRNCSPGRLMIERTMKALHADGFRLFDFTIGDYAYKRRLGAASVPLVDVEMALSWRGAPGVAGRRAKAMARANPHLKRLAQTLRQRRRAPT